MDNIVESANYNGDSLTIETHGNGLRHWTKEKNPLWNHSVLVPGFGISNGQYWG